MNKNILITGCGGDIGQSISKICKEISSGMLVGSDVHDEHPAKFLFDKVFTIAPCSSTSYLNKLTELIKSNQISLIIPTSEAELKYFLEAGIEELGDIKMIMASPEIRMVGFDKLETVKKLKELNLPYPKTEIIKNIVTTDYPSILKSRSGSGSKNLFSINDQTDFDYLKSKYPSFIAQEFIPMAEGEYTCCIFKSSNITKTIAIKRKLIEGYTGYGEVVKNPSITDFLEKLAYKLQFRGSINVQLRLKDGIPYVFEINPRFSSTVYFRHLVGFKDLLWSIQNQLGLLLEDTVIDYQSKIYRGNSEFVEKKRK